MLKAIREFVERQIMAPSVESGTGREHALRLATAALLIEMSRQDETVHEVERQAVREALLGHFGLEAQEVEVLYGLAEAELDGSTDYYQFTSLLRQHLSPEQKEQVVELLWHVAVSDGHIDTYEEHMVRRIAELLYLNHSAFIRAKHRALGE